MEGRLLGCLVGAWMLFVIGWIWEGEPNAFYAGYACGATVAVSIVLWTLWH